MNAATDSPSPLDARIAARLKSLRQDRGWSLDDLAGRCGISRATLSRLEKAEVSPTAAVLGKLCATYAMTMSRLMALVETEFSSHIPRQNQIVWDDAQSGYSRRSVSPPAPSLTSEVLECTLAAGSSISYETPPRPGLEHHLIVLEGHLEMDIEGQLYQLNQGDCLRYLLFGSSRFSTLPDLPATYILVIT